MRLMTVNSTNEGLIEIAEAPDQAPQIIIFAIPIDIREIKKIESFNDLHNFLASLKFYSTLYHRNGKENIVFESNFSDNRYNCVSRYHGSVINFYIDPTLNFNINSNKRFIRIGRKRLRATKNILREVYRRMFRLHLPFVQFKWQYVGTINKALHQDKRFLILSIDSTKQLDLLYLQHKSFFVNPS